MRTQSNFKQVMISIGSLVLVLVLGLGWIYDDASKPVVSKSASNDGQIVQVEVWGKKVPVEEFNPEGARYHELWVK
jgi:hypothetical protein